MFNNVLLVSILSLLIHIAKGFIHHLLESNWYASNLVHLGMRQLFRFNSILF